MQLDPTKWLVSLAGFIYDWIITREWKRIIFSMIPIYLLIGSIVLVWWGSTTDRRALASWYKEQGDEEIAAWEESWLDTANSEDGVDSGKGVDSKGTDDSADSEEPRAISPFADLLFRRVEQLAPSDYAQYVIGASLIQRGALEQGREMLSKIAPDDQSGYPQAHAFLAMVLMTEFQDTPPEGRNVDQINQLRHHIGEAIKAERVPNILLTAGSDLSWQQSLRDPNVDKRRAYAAEAVGVLNRAAESDPALYLPLAQRADAVGNRLIYEQALAKSDEYLRSELEEDPANAQARVQLAQLEILKAGVVRKLSLRANQPVEQKQVDQEQSLLATAEAILQEGRAEDPANELLNRAMSNMYILRYQISKRWTGQSFSANQAYLAKASDFDDNNPKVFEELARIASLIGKSNPEQKEKIIAQLELRMAKGNLTTFTHFLLARIHLLDNNFEKALPELMQVITAAPLNAQALNNAAFVIAEMYPDRLEEALNYAQRSVLAAKKDPNGDFYDTLGTVLSKLNRPTEAITAYETAVSLIRGRKDFHNNLAREYERIGNMTRASVHRQIIAEIEAAEKKAAAERKAAAEQAQEEPDADLLPSSANGSDADTLLEPNSQDSSPTDETSVDETSNGQQPAVPK